MQTVRLAVDGLTWDTGAAWPGKTPRSHFPPTPKQTREINYAPQPVVTLPRRPAGPARTDPRQSPSELARGSIALTVFPAGRGCWPTSRSDDADRGVVTRCWPVWSWPGCSSGTASASRSPAGPPLPFRHPSPPTDSSHPTVGRRDAAPAASTSPLLDETDGVVLHEGVGVVGHDQTAVALDLPGVADDLGRDVLPVAGDLHVALRRVDRA